jgi:UDP-3-O-[3-hydroxymyristoyl] glucosamine N-acyltransferase
LYDTSVKLRDLADQLGVSFEGDGEREIEAAQPIESSEASELSFVGNRQALGRALGSRAGCLIVPRDFDNASGRALIRAERPRELFAAAVKILHPASKPQPGVHPTATVAASARIAPSAAIGPGCCVGDGVSIGEDCLLHPNVTLYAGVTLGSRVTLHSGCVIGADGFGFVFTGDHYEKFPQVGTVVLEDDVEIGANSCVDRAALGITRIGQGTKLDNMVHIGHNCNIGKHVVIAAQTGLSGGVEVGDYSVIGGQVGIGDKARIESRSIVGSGSGILTSKIVRAGEPVWGTPARPLKQYLKQLAAIGRLTKLREEIVELNLQVAQLKARNT